MLAVLLAWALAGGGSALGAPIISWSSPKLIDAAVPLGHTAALDGVACPSTMMCVAAGDNLFTSTAPGAGPWQQAPLPVPASAVSCPSTELCVATALGHVLWSSNPSAGAWNSAPVDGGKQLTAISCPTTLLCVAADTGGDVLTSTDPTGGAGTWAATQLVASDPTEPPMYVSCAAERMCVAVYGGLVLSTTDPAGGASAWSSATVDSQGPLTGVTCPAATSCVAIDGAGNVLTSTNPAGGASAWQAANVDGTARLTGVACASAAMCVAADATGNVVSSSNPTGGAQAWSPPISAVPPSGAAGSADPAVSCPSSALCVLVDRFGAVMTSSAPSVNWQLAAIDGANTLQSVSCAASTCVALDDAGRVLSTRAGASWKTRRLSSLQAGTAASLSCSTGPLCVIFAGSKVISSTNPAGQAPGWKPVDLGRHVLVAGSCPSRSVCVALDSSGNVLRSTNPTGDASGWRTSAVKLVSPTAISCPTTSFCAAVDARLDVAVGGAGAWHVGSLAGGRAALPPAISCPTSILCAIVSGETVLTSTDPAGKWKRVRVDVPAPLTKISCPSPAICVASDQSGDVITSTNPTGGSATWTRSAIDPGNAISSLSCAPGRCIAGDIEGNVLVGTSQGVARKKALAALRAVVDSCSLQRFITILQRGGCPVPMTSPGIGAVTITWFDTHGKTIALGTSNTPPRGLLIAHIQLTSTGKRLLANATQEIPVQVRASFEDLAGHTYSQSSSITLLP